MKQLLILSVLLITSSLFAGEKQISPAGFYKISSEADQSLGERSKYIFIIQNLPGYQQKATVLYSVDGGETKTKNLKNSRFEVITTPGKHVFVIYLSEDYYEIYSDSLAIEKGFTDSYSVHLAINSDLPIMVEKPVIYLYPEVETEVNVHVRVPGQMQFTYPEMNDGWKVMAAPNGELSIGEKKYNYLFWEANQTLNKVETQSGFVVEGTKISTFLEEHLNQIGFTSKEAADFITYWGPRMAQHDRVFLRFEMNESCEQFGTLSIDPQPDHINRCYILWFPTSMKDAFIVRPQLIQKLDRSGFDVLEWGGLEIINSEL